MEGERKKGQGGKGFHRSKRRIPLRRNLFYGEKREKGDEVLNSKTGATTWLIHREVGELRGGGKSGLGRWFGWRGHS